MLALTAACSACAWAPGSPLEPLGGGRPEGDRGWAWAFVASAAAALTAYALALVVLRRRPERLRAVAAIAAAVQLVPLAAPLLLSTDVWTYWSYGRIAAVHDADPYEDTPADFPGDPSYPYVGAAWRESTSVYGPAFTLASEPLALAAGESARRAAWIWKTAAALAMLGATSLAAALARRRALAAAFVGWNPVLALHFAGGGHNDAWVALLVVGALALAVRARRRLAGAAWAIAALVKWVPLALLPLVALDRRRRPVFLGFAAGASAVVALAVWRYGWSWLGAFGPLARNANAETRYALPSRLEQLGVPEPLPLVTAAVAFAGVYGWLVWRASRGETRLAAATVAVLLATPYLAPWYLAWAAPLAAAEDDELAGVLVLALSAYLLPQTVPL